MSLPTAASSLVTLAAEHTEHNPSLNPYLTGGGALVVLFLLLWVTTRFNRDR
ncbi:hypothetical protein [Streptomyces solincola]|uniref:hypothetical protein n=1 Tax=Streptomyces solincola TaxID=2100817 RepID=UPI0015E3DE71|nr:hypothetical protein [Streptomyces solincola]